VTGSADVTLAADSRQWGQLLDRLSRDHEGDRVTIERLEPDRNVPGAFGDQAEALRLPFTYASYDPRDNVVVVAVGGTTATFPVVLRHLIWKPAQLHPDKAAFRVVDGDGIATVVTFFPGHPQ
jgi:hypothetical protein